MTQTDRESIRALNDALVAIVRDFQLLGPLSWPLDVQKAFLESVARGNPELPEYTPRPVDCTERISALKRLIMETGADDHPAVMFIRKNAQSYLTAYRILESAGTPAVTEHSRTLYGHPHDRLQNYGRRHLDVAKYFLKVANSYTPVQQSEQLRYSAAEFKDILQGRVGERIVKDRVTVTVDREITARATAGPDYVKIRHDARFSEHDIRQLLHHEVFTHTLTYLNGRKQPILSCLGYNAPRTTATQEGLATFAEYITYSIELGRLKRIALRIVAIDKALDGANLIDLFRFFQKHGQDVEESYYSAMRIFRGGVPEGGIVFLKDNVYLRGLIEVESFLKRAMHEGSLHDMDLLFTGKLTTRDIPLLHALEEEGYIEAPLYKPRWIEDVNALAAHLAFNDLTERFRERKRKA